MNTRPRIVLAGGVSGGHTFPLIAVARALKLEFSSGVEFLFIGARGAFPDEAFQAENIPTKYVFSGKIRRYFSLRNAIDPFLVPIGMIQALWQLFRFLPDAVFAKGGSASVPVVLAAWLYRIPIVIQDSDAVAGRANRFLSRFATRIAIAYPSAHAYFPLNKTALLGNPIRNEITRGNADEAAKIFSLSIDKPTILFIGGSLGARALNQALLRILSKLLASGYQIIHQTGRENDKQTKEDIESLGIKEGQGYVSRPFFTGFELAHIFALSSVIVSRAGANAISEFASVRKACILVPLPSAANDEQRANAYEIAKMGGAVVMEEANLGENLLYSKIYELLADADLRHSMGEKLNQFYHPNAARDIAIGIKNLIA